MNEVKKKTRRKAKEKEKRNKRKEKKRNKRKEKKQEEEKKQVTCCGHNQQAARPVVEGKGGKWQDKG